MSRRKRKKKQKARSANRVVQSRVAAEPVLASRVRLGVKAVFGFVSGSGLLLALLAGAYRYVNGPVSLRYVGALDRGYELELKNAASVDREVVRFEIKVPVPQDAVYETTEAVSGTMDPFGRVVLPGGPTSTVPIAEFRGLDGRALPAGSAITFHVPPLSNRTWVKPVASVVDVWYEVRSSNPLLAMLEGAASSLGLRARVQAERYAVIQNDWRRTDAATVHDAVIEACREDETMVRTDLCSRAL